MIDLFDPIRAELAWRPSDPPRLVSRFNRPRESVLFERQLEALRPQVFVTLCAHKRTRRGKDIPRVYGSFRSQVCIDCHAFRARYHEEGVVFGGVPPGIPGEWRPESEYAAATSREED